MDSIAGYDHLDSTSLNKQMPKLGQIKGNVKGKKIGVAHSAFAHLSNEYKNELNALLINLKNEGAIVTDIELPSLELAIKLYFIIAPAEAASNLSRFSGLHFGTQGAGTKYEEILTNTRELFGTEVKRRILIGNFVLFAEEYDKFFGRALKLKEQMKHQINVLFNDHDVVLLPTTASTAFELESQRTPFEMYLEDLYTVLANIYGGPAMQIPFFLQKVEPKNETRKNDFNFLPVQTHLPIGIQILSAIEREDKLIEVAKKMEEIIDWNSKWPGFELEDK
jgi:aspartyl-tRNA(Asn)/glutamyl-tRNA(Gln) amidotransferase subunit A